MATEGSEAEAVLALIQKVTNDSHVPQATRRLTRRLVGSGHPPSLSLLSLQAQAGAVLPALQRRAPRVGLARAVTAASYLRHYSSPEIRDAFSTPDDFVAYVESSSDPDATISSSLGDADPIFAWQRSWLAPASRLRGMKGPQVVSALEMVGQAPIVLFHMDLDQLRGAGITVRVPCALDAAIGPNYQWRPGGPASGVPEYVDGDIPRSAISRLEWRA
jgi:hypothetical protein